MSRLRRILPPNESSLQRRRSPRRSAGSGRSESPHSENRRTSRKYAGNRTNDRSGTASAIVRGCCTYCTRFAAPVYDPAQQQVWLQFEGVNASAAVLLNGQQLCTHDGGYSTFRAEVTELLQAENQLTVRVVDCGFCNF